MPSRLLQNQIVVAEHLRQWVDARRLYAILDACDAPAVPGKATELGGSRAVSLYRGTAEEDFWAFAPYLAQVDDELLDWITVTLWQEPWGLFVLADDALPDDALAALRTHFRHFLIVDDPQRKEMYFRFYDPRVLQKFLPTCTEGELKQLYGQVKTFLFADPADTETLTGVSRAEAVGAAAPVPTAHRIGQRFAIRQAQMDAFGEEAETAFERRLMAHLREHHADMVNGFPDNILLEMVRGGIAKGRGYGMTWESNLTAFVALMFEIAPNFDTHPRIHLILNSRQIPSEEKIDQVTARTPPQVWDELKGRRL